jgi:hypothetical protein
VPAPITLTSKEIVNAVLNVRCHVCPVEPGVPCVDPSGMARSVVRFHDVRKAVALNLVLQVGCPTCRVAAGEPCRNLQTKSYKAPPHEQRDIEAFAAGIGGVTAPGLFYERKSVRNPWVTTNCNSQKGRLVRFVLPGKRHRHLWACSMTGSHWYLWDDRQPVQKFRRDMSVVQIVALETGPPCSVYLKPQGPGVVKHLMIDRVETLEDA